MKRSFALFLVICLMVSLSACGTTKDLATSASDLAPDTSDSVNGSGNKKSNSLIQTVFDDSGNAVKTVFYTPDGAIVGWYESEYSDYGGEERRSLYDAEGNLLAVTGLDENGNDIGFEGNYYRWFSIDEDGKELRSEHFIDGVFYDEYQYFYNDHNDLIQTIRSGSVEEIWQRTNYYNENNQLFMSVSDHEDGRYYTYEYDNEGRLITRLNFDVDDTLLWKWTYQYSDYVKEMTFYNEYGSGQPEKTLTIYDEDNRVQMMLFYDVNGQFESAVLYLYHIFNPYTGISCSTSTKPVG